MPDIRSKDRPSAGIGITLMAMAVVLSLFTLLLVAYVATALFYYIFQERFIFVRYQLAPRSRFRFKFPYEERYLEAGRGVRLHALYFRADAPRGVVLYFHGNTGNLRRWGKLAPRFTALGYDVLMPDYRDYGKSGGRLSPRALQADALLWYDSLGHAWGDERIVVYGRSLGSGMAVPVAAARAPRLLVLETPFANMYDVARNFLWILPYKLLLRYPFRNDRAVRRVRCPVHIFHGKRDDVVPYNSALKLYSMVPTDVHREMHTFPKGHHSDLARFARFNREMRRVLG